MGSTRKGRLPDRSCDVSGLEERALDVLQGVGGGGVLLGLQQAHDSAVARIGVTGVEQEGRPDRVGQLRRTGWPEWADSVAASARRRAAMASPMPVGGVVPASTASMKALSSMR